MSYGFQTLLLLIPCFESGNSWICGYKFIWCC